MTSHRGFIWFILGLALAFYFGGAIQVFSSKKNLESWLQRHLQKEKVQFSAEWKDIRISLANGWLPALGVEVEELRIRPQDPCLVEGELYIDHANISLDWWSWLFSGVVRIAQFKANTVEISWGESECVLSKWSSHSLESWRDLFRNRWALELKKNREWLDSVRINELHIRVLGKRPFDVSFMNFHFNTGKVFKLTSQLKLPQIENARLDVEADEDGVVIKSKIALKEGSFTTDAKLSVHDEAMKTDVIFQNVPFYSFMSLWNWWTNSSLEFKPRRLWVEGLAHFSISLAEAKVHPVFIERLNVKGEAGHIQLNPFSWDLELHQLTDNLIFNVNKLSLNAFIDNLDQFMPKLGFLNGQGRLEPSGKLKFNGFIENVEIYFFNLSARARQSIASLDVNAVGQLNEYLEADFDNFKIVGGELRDKVIWKWQIKENKVEWVAQISHMVLSQDVQRLLWGQMAEPLAADFSIVNEKDEWSMAGRVRVPSFSTDDFTVKNLELYKTQRAGLNPWRMKVQQLDLVPDQRVRTRLYPWLSKEQHPKVSLGSVSGNLEFGRDRWSWEDVRGQLLPSKLNWKTKGSWVKTAGLHGILESESGFGKKKFEVLGGSETWEIKPQDAAN